MATIATEPGGDVLASLRGSARRRRKERAIQAVLVGAAVVSILISAGIVLALVFRALNFLSDVDLGSLWSGSGAPVSCNSTCCRSSSARSSSRGSPCSWRRRSGWARRSTSSEYAHPRARRTLKPILETLAGIPSVVMGFFALTVINPDIVQGLFGAASRSR